MATSTVLGEQDDLRELVQQALRGAEANERPDLIRRLTTAADLLAAAPVSRAEAASVTTGVLRSLRSLEIDLRTRLAALEDPGRKARLVAESEHAQARRRQFEQRVAGWPRVLDDALSAVVSDAEFTLQSRLRGLLEEATAAVESRNRDEGAPAWLRARFTAEVDACHQALRSAAEVVTRRIATSTGLTLGQIDLPLIPATELVPKIGQPKNTGAPRQPISARLIAVVMPTYGGMMIALVLPKLLGLRLPVWLIVVLAAVGALAMGGAALSGERQRQISRRNADSVADLRSAVDALRLALGKQVRDSVRLLERHLHAAVGAAVEQHTRRLAMAATRTRQAAEDSRRTESAVTDVQSDLAAVQQLQRRAMSIAQERLSEFAAAAHTSVRP